MGMLLAISIGLREQNTLAMIFMLLFTTMWLGFLTELYSRPVIHVDNVNYQWPVGRLGFIEQPDYVKNTNSLHLIDQALWEVDRQVRDEDNRPLAIRPNYLVAQRCSNYVRRMVPHVLGIFPFVTVVVVMVYHLEYAKWRLTQETDLAMPWWVLAVLYGSFLIFSSFALVQIVYQWLPPGYYWGSEVCYCILSLTAKMWLGLLMLLNVIMQDRRANDSLGGAALEPAR